jgi:hypothetical protein
MRTYPLAFVLAVAACGGSNHDTTPDASTPPGDGSGSGDNTVVFNYTPAWDGVVSVDVLGAFGKSDDWTAPLVSLSNSGGTWTGTTTLPAGTYTYVFHVVGDASAGAKSDTYDRYALDPASSAYIVCPQESPTYSAEMNPCSQISVPYVESTISHVRGKVVVDGIVTASPPHFIVLIERQETGTHHFFVNRATTSDGTYDLPVAAGSYRIQVQHPDYLDKTDMDIDPTTVNLLRRNLTGHFDTSADVAVSDAEMSFHDYPLFAPTPSATLPTTFTFTAGTNAHLEIYGTGTEIGDPWFNSDVTKTGQSTFAGTFNTPKAKTPGAEMGKTYMWGIEQPHAPDSSGISWTGQTLAFPITWTSIQQ